MRLTLREGALEQTDLISQVSDRTLRQALEMAGMGVWQRDLRTNLCQRSPSIDTMFGFAPGEAGEDAGPFLRRIHPDDAIAMHGDIGYAAAVGAPMSREFRVVLPSGRIRWVLARGEVVKGADGTPERIVTVMMDVTSRRYAEEALHSSEEKLQLAIDATDLGLWDYDIVSGNVIWSDRLKAFYGLQPDAKVDFYTFSHSSHPDDRDRILRTYEAALDPASGGHFKIEHRVIAPDGSLRWLLGSGQVVFDNTGKPVRCIGTALDITERKRAEQALTRSESRLRLALDAARLGTYDRDLRGETGRFSPRGAELHGLPTERPEYTLKSWLDIIHPDDRAYVAERVARAVAGPGLYEADYRVVWPDGQIRWVAARGEIIRDDAGTPVRVAGIVYDVTERKRADEALRANEEWMRLTMAGARVGSWSWEAGTNLVTYSDWLMDLYGLPRGERLTREQIRSLRIDPEDRDRASQAFESALRDRHDYDVEYRVRRPDGSVIWVHVMGRGEYDAAGRPVQMLGIIQDITERKRADEALRENEARLRIITDSVPGAISYVDSERRFRFVNAVFADWYGMPREQIVDRKVRAIMQEKDYQLVAPWGGRALQGEDVMFERAMATPGQPIRHLLVRYFPDRDANGVVRGFYSLAIDISERKQAEERLKLLAAEVDHRAKNMLALVQIMLRQTKAETVREFTAAAQGRVAALARAHVVLSERRWVGADLQRLLEEELAPYRAHASSRVAISGPPVALESRAAQSCALALHELATNAAKYGALSVPGGRVECAWSMTPDRTVALTWTESGGPPAKKPGRRGFGMNVIERSIADQLEGKVQFEWRDEGLRCTMRLPASSISG
jgi:PAS domain S-box-containing protein